MRIYIETEHSTNGEFDVESIPRIGETVYFNGGYWKVSDIIHSMEDRYTKYFVKIIIQPK